VDFAIAADDRKPGCDRRMLMVGWRTGKGRPR